MVVEIMPEPLLRLEVPGFPRPQGSKKAFVNKKTGKAQMGESSGENLATWRADITVLATRARPAQIITGPVQTVIEFRFPRSKSHYGTGRNSLVLKATAPAYPVSVGRHGDLEKLERAVNDALTAAGVWDDDILVVDSHTTKVFATDARDVGAAITVFPLRATIAETPPWPKEAPCNP